MPRKQSMLADDHAREIARTWARERPDLDPFDYLLHIYLIRIGRILERAADQRSKGKFGLSIAEVRVLLALRRAGGNHVRRPTDLFHALLVTSGAITKNVDRLETVGMVKRLPDPNDKGGVLIRLTAQGKRLADDYMTELTLPASILSRSQISLSRTERKAMVHLCEQILLDLENQKDGAERPSEPQTSTGRSRKTGSKR
jgi:DNA-binding MarR family transcriptional regulator